MSKHPADIWVELNHRYLLASFQVIRCYLERCVEDGPLDEVKLARARAELHRIERDISVPAALQVLCSTFGLTDFERNLLLICAYSELDQGIGDICAAIQGSLVPSFGLALRALPDAAWGPLAPDAPLRRWHMLELGEGPTLASRGLHLDEYVLHYLLGLSNLDERLQGIVEPVTDDMDLSETQLSSLERVMSLWMSDRREPILCLCSSVGMAARVAAREVCAHHALRTYALQAGDIPDSPADQIKAARLWERHAALTSSALLVEISNERGRDKAEAFCERVRGPLLVSSQDTIRLHRRTVVRVDIPRPQSQEQRTLWHQALGDSAADLSDTISKVSAHFSLDSATIEAVATEVGTHHRNIGGTETAKSMKSSDAVARHFWQACRIQARPRLDDLAQRIESRATWDDLIVSGRQRRQLREVALHVDHRTTVYNKWGYSRKSARGLGISALFAGPSGTGKTTAAEVLANELELDLYRVDLSSVVSKYIGETEKNLRRIFDAAEGGGAILLFDEADALFGKRSDVKDSHDRYANMEVSYLLQRMESYRGLAILTSNLRDSVDTAFMRRIRFMIEFPFPTLEQRTAIWKSVFPDRTPTRDLDFNKLAKLNLSGGNIRNVAIAAAFLAVEDNEPVQMKHLQAAVRTELAKLERTAPERELRAWV